jgi:hypothetical protein
MLLVNPHTRQYVEATDHQWFSEGFGLAMIGEIQIRFTWADETADNPFRYVIDAEDATKLPPLEPPVSPYKTLIEVVIRKQETGAADLEQQYGKRIKPLRTPGSSLFHIYRIIKPGVFVPTDQAFLDWLLAEHKISDWGYEEAKEQRGRRTWLSGSRKE